MSHFNGQQVGYGYICLKTYSLQRIDPSGFPKLTRERLNLDLLLTDSLADRNIAQAFLGKGLVNKHILDHIRYYYACFAEGEGINLSAQEIRDMYIALARLIQAWPVVGHAICRKLVAVQPLRGSHRLLIAFIYMKV